VALDPSLLSEDQTDSQPAVPVQSQPALRVVNAPTPAPVVQKIKPKVEAVEIASQISAGGGGGGGGKKKGGGGGKAKSS